MIQATSTTQPVPPAEHRPNEPASRLSGGVVPAIVILVIVIVVVMRRRRRGQ
jgi:hypothetical protein